MPDLSLLAVLVLVMVGVVAYARLRGTLPAPPQCPDCGLAMVHETDLPDPAGPGGQRVLDRGSRFGDTRVGLFRCPRCGREARVQH